MSRWKRVCGLLGAAALLTSCGAATLSQPPDKQVHPALPASSWPSAYKTNGVCAVAVTDPSATTTDQLPAQAQSAELYWYEGFYSHTCRTYHSSLDAADSTKLLADLRAIPPRQGIYNCTMSVGKFVQIWFKVSGGFTSFRINLDGCVFYLPKDPLDLGPWPPFMPAPRGRG